MDGRLVFFLFFLVEAACLDVTLMPDRPSLQVTVSDTAILMCCYKCSTNLSSKWMYSVMVSHNVSSHNLVNLSDRKVKEIKEESPEKGVHCKSLELTNVMTNDTGLYRCLLNHIDLNKDVVTPGTYLQVFKPIHKTLNISEQAKNSIITAEGVLLLLCVLVPGAALICKSQGFNELEKRKGKEEDNIYEGLNLDDCTSTYHQIQRSHVHGSYQDVGATFGEDNQFEKP